MLHKSNKPRDYSGQVLGSDAMFQRTAAAHQGIRDKAKLFQEKKAKFLEPPEDTVEEKETWK